MTDEDRDLLEAIREAGDKAAAATPYLLDTLAIASLLARRFEHRSVDAIREQVRQELRGRGLFWADS